MPAFSVSLGKFGPGSVKSDVMYAEEDEDLIDSDEEFFFIEDQQGLERVQSKPGEWILFNS